MWKNVKCTCFFFRTCNPGYDKTAESDKQAIISVSKQLYLKVEKAVLITKIYYKIAGMETIFFASFDIFLLISKMNLAYLLVQQNP